MPTDDDAQKRREDCRREVLRFLALRQQLFHEAEAIRRRLNRDGADFTLDEVNAALAFLVSLENVKVNPDPLGATPHYQATAQGVLFNERNP
ncbi:MAG: hypothetical protein PHI35_09285 [Victivallaceae bacterium]|nr:hypothetical protein [Victivallaceae bacterium]